MTVTDALDMKIIRALLSERTVAPSNHQVSSSLRSIAARLGADDVTVNYRYKKLRESGALSGWRLALNPTLFGCKSLDATVDVQPESGKPDMIRKLSLMNEVVGIQDFYGRGLKTIVMYRSDEARSRAVELISRITNAETMTQVRWVLPASRTKRLTTTDVAIIRALSNDARMPLDEVARRLGLSTKTVRNHVEKLRRENTIHALPTLNMGGIPGLIPVHLSYSYSMSEPKSKVDSSILSHFETKYLSIMFSDPDRGYIWLFASTMNDVRDHLEWAKSQPGIASARIDILVKWLTFPEKLLELLNLNNGAGTLQEDAYLRA
ncbi:MAG: AsnC family transcriptional regulator [Thaumarchaeota archaeon]|nr:AsnC family transcriptional regulator [Nitrososphaerota archaeon]